jgi:DNA polymerase-3 subunit epsilon
LWRLNRQLTGKNLHFYINPERDSEEGALAVHGLTTEFLADKPKFKQIAAEFLDYVRGAQIIIHNAPFDVGFLDAELALLGLPPFKEHVRRGGLAADGQGAAPGQAQFAGCAVRPLRHFQRPPRAARRAAGCGAAGRRLSVDDARPEFADHGPGPKKKSAKAKASWNWPRWRR